MASRGPAGPRGTNNRFAQFKLVLLGELPTPLSEWLSLLLLTLVCYR